MSHARRPRRRPSRRAPWGASLPLLALLGLLPAACGEPAGDEPAADEPAADAAPARVELSGALAGEDCLIILLDALRADHLGCYGAEPSPTPTLDALAARGVRMARATSQSSWTLPSTASLFTGLYQETHGLAFGVGLEALRLVDAAVTLAELFDEAGYGTWSWTQNTFASETYALHQGFQQHKLVNYYVDDGDDMADLIAAELAQPSERPRLVYAHFRRPHTPFDPPAEFLPQSVEPQGGRGDAEDVGTDGAIARHNSGRVPMSDADLDRHRALYRANVRATDAHVARLLDAIDTERTLVVVLSDHGEAFGEHGRLGHNWLSYQEYVHIPWIMAHPRLPVGEVVDAPVMTIDVLPTLAELFALDVEGLPLQGASLVPRLEGGPPPRRAAVFSSSRVGRDGTQQLIVSDGRFKLVRTLPGGGEQLFDLDADPGETSDVRAEHEEHAARLSDLLDRWRASQSPSLASPTGELPPEALENLEALGYLGGDDGR